MKKIPKDVIEKINRLRKEGLSFSEIAKQVTNEGFKISRPTVSKLCQSEVITEEEAPKEEAEEKLGDITKKVADGLDSSKEIVSDAIQSIAQALNDPILGKWAKEQCGENGLVTNDDFEAWVEAEEERQRQLEEEIRSLKEQVSFFGQYKIQAEQLQKQLQQVNKELERLREVERGFEKFIVLQEDKIDPYLKGVEQGKQEALEYIASHPDQILKTILAAKFPPMAKFLEKNNSPNMKDVMMPLVMGKIMEM